MNTESNKVGINLPVATLDAYKTAVELISIGRSDILLPYALDYAIAQNDPLYLDYFCAVAIEVVKRLASTIVIKNIIDRIPTSYPTPANSISTYSTTLIQALMNYVVQHSYDKTIALK